MRIMVDAGLLDVLIRGNQAEAGLPVNPEPVMNRQHDRGEMTVVIKGAPDDVRRAMNGDRLAGGSKGAPSSSSSGSSTSSSAYAAVAAGEPVLSISRAHATRGKGIPPVADPEAQRIALLEAERKVGLISRANARMGGTIALSLIHI